MNSKYKEAEKLRKECENLMQRAEPILQELYDKMAKFTDIVLLDDLGCTEMEYDKLTEKFTRCYLEEDILESLGILIGEFKDRGNNDR